MWHRRQGRENTAELDEAIGQVREGLQELQWRRAVIPVAVVAALVLLATLARNPSRWALLLVALGALAAGVTVVRDQRAPPPRRLGRQATTSMPTRSSSPASRGDSTASTASSAAIATASWPRSGSRVVSS